MRRSVKTLVRFATLCFALFVAAGLTAIVSGVVVVLTRASLETAWGATFTLSFLLTIAFGLFVSGTRSMIEALAHAARIEREERAREGPSER